VELTTGDNGNAWWSLAFEAFGEDDCLMEHLQAVASCVFKSYRGSNLQAKDSYAYPSWLCVLSSAPLAHLQEHLITLATYQPF